MSPGKARKRETNPVMRSSPRIKEQRAVASTQEAKGMGKSISEGKGKWKSPPEGRRSGKISTDRGGKHQKMEPLKKRLQYTSALSYSSPSLDNISSKTIGERHNKKKRN